AGNPRANRAKRHARGRAGRAEYRGGDARRPVAAVPVQPDRRTGAGGQALRSSETVRVSFLRLPGMGAVARHLSFEDAGNVEAFAHCVGLDPGLRVRAAGHGVSVGRTRATAGTAPTGLVDCTGDIVNGSV